MHRLGTNMTTVSITHIENTQTYNSCIDIIKQHGMNLIIELPKQSQGEPSDRRLAHFKRLQKFASVTNKVYVFAPRSSPHWAHWKFFRD